MGFEFHRSIYALTLLALALGSASVVAQELNAPQAAKPGAPNPPADKPSTFVAKRPVLDIYTLIDPPAAFCTEIDRNIFLEHQFKTQTASAARNVERANGYLAALNQLYAERTAAKASFAELTAIHDEIDAYQAVATEMQAASAGAQAIYPVALSRPVGVDNCMAYTITKAQPVQAPVVSPSSLAQSTAAAPVVGKDIVVTGKRDLREILKPCRHGDDKCRDEELEFIWKNYPEVVEKECFKIAQKDAEEHDTVGELARLGFISKAAVSGHFDGNLNQDESYVCNYDISHNLKKK